MNILVAGSLAYDHLMRFHGRFEDHILPHMLSSLSAVFTTPTQEIYFGGCGGNIAYTLKLLGGNPLLFGVAGKDFTNYAEWLDRQGIGQQGIVRLEDIYTACAFILTDEKLNQLTIFQEGAMSARPEALSISNFLEDKPVWAIIAPDDARRMGRLARECHEHGIPYIFDPAQQIGGLSPEELKISIRNASILIVNRYEAELLQKKLGIDHAELTAMAPHYIETHGEEGSRIFSEGKWEEVAAVPPVIAKNPTGCGDAFRAGVLFGLSRHLDLASSCRIGALAATYNLEQEGTQGHHFTLEEFGRRFEDFFGSRLL